MKYWNKEMNIGYNLKLIIFFVIRWIFAGLLLFALAIIYFSLITLNSGILLCFGKEDYHTTFYKKIANNIELWEQKYDL
tara:strand:+ start:251 stop:487 length:237 start_codon:yes stop_codon:yes gene_type:complete